MCAVCLRVILITVAAEWSLTPKYYHLQILLMIRSECLHLCCAYLFCYFHIVTYFWCNFLLLAHAHMCYDFLRVPSMCSLQ